MAYKKAFTIVELLVVIVVIGVLSAIVLLSYMGVINKAVIASLSSDLLNVSKQLSMFQMENNSYPNTLDCSQADSSVNKCIKLSGETSLSYQHRSTGLQAYCLSATKNDRNFYVSSDILQHSGPCPIFSLNAGSKSSYPGSGTNWYDISGNSNDGTLANGPVYSSTFGGTFTFDGVNDRVTIGGANLMPQYMSIEAVVNVVSSTTSSSEYWLMAMPYPNSPWETYGIRWISSSGKYILRFDAYDKSVSTADEFSFNTLHHVVATYDGSSAKIYVDGHIQGTTNGTGALVYSGGYPLSVGCRETGSVFCTNISVNLVNIYNQALTATDVNNNYHFINKIFSI